MVLERLDRAANIEERTDLHEKKKPIIAGQEICDLELEEILVKTSQMFRELLKEGQDSISLHRIKFGYLAEIFGMKGQGSAIQTRFESFRDKYLFNFIDTHERGKACRFTEPQFLVGSAEVYISKKYGLTDSEEITERTKEALGPGPIAEELEYREDQDIVRAKKELEQEKRRLSNDERKLLESYDADKINKMILKLKRSPHLGTEWVVRVPFEVLTNARSNKNPNGFPIAPNAVFDRVVEVADLAYAFKTTGKEPENGDLEMTYFELRKRLGRCLSCLNEYNTPNLGRLREIIYTNIDKREQNEY